MQASALPKSFKQKRCRAKEKTNVASGYQNFNHQVQRRIICFSNMMQVEFWSNLLLLAAFSLFEGFIQVSCPILLDSHANWSNLCIQIFQNILYNVPSFLFIQYLFCILHCSINKFYQLSNSCVTGTLALELYKNVWALNARKCLLMRYWHAGKEMSWLLW